ncbi:MAG: guanylate kinase [Rickettsiaceae bacterium]
MNTNAMIIILSAPSGGGKSSIAQQLLALDTNLVLSISATTRKARTGEKDGEHYFFCTRKQFNELELLEQAEIYGNLYGTPKSYVDQKLASGHDVLFDIDAQGAYQIMQKAHAKVVSIFILPPSIDELEARLKKRGQDNQESIKLRLQAAKEEITNADNYHYALINDDLALTVKEIKNIIDLERRQSNKHA